jgi:hypothetical protein
MADQSAVPATTTQLIEGGSTIDEPRQPVTIKGPFDLEKHRGVLTFALVILLGVMILGHYICILVLEWNGKKSDGVTNAFTTSLPVISGLVGSGVAYYFTRRDSSNASAK